MISFCFFFCNLDFDHWTQFGDCSRTSPFQCSWRPRAANLDFWDFWFSQKVWYNVASYTYFYCCIINNNEFVKSPECCSILWLAILISSIFRLLSLRYFSSGTFPFTWKVSQQLYGITTGYQLFKMFTNYKDSICTSVITLKAIVV